MKLPGRVRDARPRAARPFPGTVVTMSLRQRCLAIAVALAALGPTTPPALADTVAEKPRLAIAIAGATPAFVTALGAKLAATRRFQVVDGRTARGKLGGIPLTAAFTPADALKARKAANVELLLDGRWQPSGNTVRITTRLFDFRNGEFSRDLSLIGDTSSADTLAGQLAAFIRHAAPLRCLVKDLEEDQLLLDLGEADGVKVDTLCRVYRHPANMKPRELGVVRITDVQPFAARAEVEEAPKGTVFERGDLLVEKTADYLFE
jgi:hypothetical protein